MTHAFFVFAFFFSYIAAANELQSAIMEVLPKAQCAVSIKSLNKPAVKETISKMYSSEPKQMCGKWSRVSGGKKLNFRIACDPKTGGLALSGSAGTFKGLRLCKLTKSQLSRVGYGHLNVKNDLFGYVKTFAGPVLIRIRVGEKGIGVKGISSIGKWFNGGYSQRSQQFKVAKKEAAPVKAPEEIVASPVNTQVTDNSSAFDLRSPAAVQ